MQEASSLATTTDVENSGISTAISVPEDAFEKVMIGLTGGLPSGEKGLKKFIQENPPPAKAVSFRSRKYCRSCCHKEAKIARLAAVNAWDDRDCEKSYQPILHVPRHCAADHRLKGRASFWNWDRLIMFHLEELERKAESPLVENPESSVLQAMLVKDPK